MPSSKISLDHAKPNKLFYFVASAVVVRRSDKRCLILKRDERETVHPGKFGTVGGKLEWEDLDLNRPSRLNGEALDFENAIENLIVREAREEAGIQIEPRLHYLSSMAFVRPDGIPVVLIKFAAAYKSGDVVLEAGAFTDYDWVTTSEARQYPLIDGIDTEVEQAIAAFTK